MDEKILKMIYKKANITEDDILSIAETWSFLDRFSPSKENVRSKFKVYDITLKDGKKFKFKMNHLTKQIMEKGEAGFDLMVE